MNKLYRVLAIIVLLTVTIVCNAQYVQSEKPFLPEPPQPQSVTLSAYCTAYGSAGAYATRGYAWEVDGSIQYTWWVWDFLPDNQSVHVSVNPERVRIEISHPKVGITGQAVCTV